MDIVNDSAPFNILLGDTYFHPEPDRVHNKDTNNRVEPIIIVENSGRLKDLQYARRNTDQTQASSSSSNASQKNDNYEVQT